MAADELGDHAAGANQLKKHLMIFDDEAIDYPLLIGVGSVDRPHPTEVARIVAIVRRTVD